jgi:hypothetical protein
LLFAQEKQPQQQEPQPQKTQTKAEQEFAGEFFGMPVPMSNYYFIKSAIIVFGNQWGAQPTTSEELENCIWDNLLLSYEAFRRGITVKQDEVDTEISKMLQAEKVAFDWKQERQAYAKWVKDKTNGSVELFQSQIEHLIQLKKLRQQVLDSIVTTANDEEAYQEFLNEYNTLSVELVQFDELKNAEEFFKKVKTNPRIWEKEKNKRPKDFKRPGFVALEFLMDIWKLPKDAVYKMMQMKVGDIYPPQTIYKGYGVFKVLQQRPADESQYPKLKESYHDQIRMKKKYDSLNDEWFKNLKKEANIKIYKKAEPVEKTAK